MEGSELISFGIIANSGDARSFAFGALEAAKAGNFEEAEELLKTDVVKKQLELLRYRNTCPIFSEDADISVECNETKMDIEWTNRYGSVKLSVDFEAETYSIEEKQ